MLGECADSVAFLHDWVAKQTRCPESGRRVLCKWRGKSLIIGNTWFANHNISEREQIWETPECPSWGDGPELLFSSERLGNLPKDIWNENMALWTQSECSLVCVSLCIMQRHNRVGPAAHFYENMGKWVNHSELNVLAWKMGIMSLAISSDCQEDWVLGMKWLEQWQALDEDSINIIYSYYTNKDNLFFIVEASYIIKG